MLIPEELELLTPARADLVDIWHYTLRSWGEEQADRYINGLFQTCQELIGHCGLGRRQFSIYPGLHVYPYAHHQVFYLVEGQTVTFVAFLHERMEMLRHLAARIPH